MVDLAVEIKKYNVLESHLNALTKERITLDEEEQKKYNLYLNEMLNKKLLPTMKENDEIFKCLFKRFMFAGSYYENLKVGKPNEFDLNLEFKLPATEIEIIDKRYPGFVEVKIKTLDEKETRRGFKNLPDWQSKFKKAWMNEDDFLHRDKVLQWMQGVVSKSIKEYDMIKFSRSGPAITLKVNERNPEGDLINFSVDLVPVFVFSKNDWPKNMHPPIDESSAELLDWCVVPKPPYNEIDVKFWRPSFYAQEKKLLNNKGGLKKSLKLIKLLRDKHNWKGLSSYYIKTVYLWETNSQEPEFWTQASTSFLLIHMLKKIQSYLDKNTIPFFWNKKHNLLVRSSPTELQNMSNRIGNILKKIDQSLEGNPSKILDFFGWPEDAISPQSPTSSLQQDTSSSRASSQRVLSSITMGERPPELANWGRSPQQSSGFDSSSQQSSGLGRSPQPANWDSSSQQSSGLGRSPQPASWDSSSQQSSILDRSPRQSNSEESNQAQAPPHDEDDIDWGSVETIMSAGAIAGAIFAAGIYLMVQNSQRKARKPQGNDSTKP